jgi:uncharacterized protein (TIGR02265 family)
MSVVVFRVVFETAFRDGLGPRLSDRLRSRMAEAGVDFSRPLLPAYPPEVFSRCMALVLEEAYPGRPVEEAQAEVAQNGFHAFTGGLVGQAVGQLMRVVGSKGSLKRLDRFLKNGQSEMSLRFVDLGPTSCEVTLAPVLGMPHYFRGMLLGGAQMLALKNPRVEVVRTEGEGATYRVSWD